MAESTTWRDLLAAQEQVIARRQALVTGLSAEAWEWRIRHTWQRVLPGVAVAHTGGLTGRQAAWAATLHADTGAALSGDAALLAFGFVMGKVVGTPGIDVAVPHGRRIAPRTMQTHEGPAVVCHPAAGLALWRGAAKGLPMVHVPAATLHAASWAASARAAEWRVAAVVQQGLCTVPRLRETLVEMPRLPRRALILTVLDDVELGAHAASELQFLRFCRQHQLPLPDELQVRVRASGTKYLDGRYRRQKVSVELDGVHHRSAGQWEADLTRSLELAVARRGTGEELVRLAPGQLRHDGPRIARLLRELLVP